MGLAVHRWIKVFIHLHNVYSLVGHVIKYYEINQLSWVFGQWTNRIFPWRLYHMYIHLRADALRWVHRMQPSREYFVCSPRKLRIFVVCTSLILLKNRNSSKLASLPSFCDCNCNCVAPSKRFTITHAIEIVQLITEVHGPELLTRRPWNKPHTVLMYLYCVKEDSNDKYTTDTYIQNDARTKPTNCIS